MADVNYLGFADLVSRRNPTAEGLDNLGATVDQNRKFQLAEGEGARRNALTDLQIQQSQTGLADTQAQQQAGTPHSKQAPAQAQTQDKTRTTRHTYIHHQARLATKEHNVTRRHRPPPPPCVGSHETTESPPLSA